MMAADSRPQPLPDMAFSRIINHAYRFDSHPPHHIGGFTLVELIVVILVTGILSVVAIERFVDSTTFDARDYSDQAKSIMRFAQKTAIAQGRSVYVVADINHFSVCTQSVCAANNLVSSPAGSNSGTTNTKAQCQIGGVYNSAWMCEGKPGTVTVTVPTGRSADVGAGGSFFFDSAGRPNKATDTVGSSTFTQLVLSFSGANVTYAVAIEAETGYVH